MGGAASALLSRYCAPIVGSLCVEYVKVTSNQIVASNQLIVEVYERKDMEQYVVRRLTPVECERLQGFPDNWTSPWEDGMWEDENGKKRKVADSNRYKALGNSIGIPSWMHVMKGCSQVLKESGIEKPLMGSLFDGIGGFPLQWEHFNGKGSAVWASEVEPFCIAVTKYHFPEEE